MDPASSSISHLANLCQWSLKWRVPFLEAGCLPILHSLLTESSIMTPIATKCAIWTDWQIITQPKQCFKPQPGISWATAAASCRQVAATKKNTVCLCVCVSVWGRLGRSGTSRISQAFREVFWSLFYSFSHSQPPSAVCWSLQCFSSPLQTVCSWKLMAVVDTVCHPYTVNKTLHFSFSAATDCSAVRQNLSFSLKQQQKKIHSPAHTHSNIGTACTISCWERLEWSPTSKATIRRKWFNSILSRRQFIIAFSFSACLCIPLWFFPWMIQRGKRKEGEDGNWNRESICAYVCVRGGVLSQERPGGHLVLEIGPHVQTKVHKHGC